MNIDEETLDDPLKALEAGLYTFYQEKGRTFFVFQIEGKNVDLKSRTFGKAAVTLESKIPTVRGYAILLLKSKQKKISRFSMNLEKRSSRLDK